VGETYAVISVSWFSLQECKRMRHSRDHNFEIKSEFRFCSVLVQVVFVTTFLFIYFANLKLYTKKWYSSHWFHVDMTK